MSLAERLELAAHLRDAGRARQNLARIAERVPPGVAEAIAALLADIPDPDGALNLFERLTAGAAPELFRALDRDRVLVHYALVVFGCSQFLGETLIQNTDLFQALHREKTLDRSRSRDEFREAFARFRSRCFETDISLLLARFKRREYVRIMLRDVLSIGTLAETTAEISALADVLIEEALRSTEAAFRKRYGTAQYRDTDGRFVDVPIAVLSLGKLGGNELNYSSDIDLLFLYGDGEDAATTRISNREYFVRLAQTVTDVLSRVTREGSAFRVDLRLRPQGGEGEPAVGLAHTLDYYEHRAGDWERQALIKVRHSAGDQALARRFIRAVQRYVYGAEWNVSAVATALEARDRIGARRRAATTHGVDVKLDRGGIRDIEFLVQSLQRVHGGEERWLRSGGTLFSLTKLHDKGHISGRDYHELTSAYGFLRQMEHRLQLRHGQQTHRLPRSRAELAILSRSVPAAGGSAAELADAVQARMARVAEIYNRIIYHQQAQQRQQRESPEFHLQGPEAGGEHSERQMLARLAQDAPSLYETVRDPKFDPQARRNLFRFLSAAFTTSERYAAVAHAPQAVENAVQLFRLSDYLTDLLVRHPEEIASLDRPGGGGHGVMPELFGGDSLGTGGGADPVFRYLSAAAESYQEKLALLRRHYRHRVFNSGARDIRESRNVFESLAETTAAADEAVAAALAIAGQPAGFAVLGLGRLGSSEFDLLSDADLIFVRDEQLPFAPATRVAEQLVQALSAYTREGTVFAVDTRLRPRGSEGELVITPAHLEQYFRDDAQAWEALSSTKLRFLAGDRELADRAQQATRVLLARFAADAGFADEVRNMRRKLERSEPDPANLKVGPGAMYDVDFIISSLAVRHGLADLRGNTRQRLQRLREGGLLAEADFVLLDDAAGFLRGLDHVIRLATGRPRRTLPVGEHARRATEELAAHVLGRRFSGGLEAELARIQSATRETYHRMGL